MAPWLVTRWEQNDFGVDAAIEITEPVSGTPDREATGRLFGVQLKATDDAVEPTTLSVTTGHLRYWLRHSLPMLLVSAHLPSRTLRGRWIDDALRLELRDRSPTFWTQDTVSVPMTMELGVSSQADIERVVARFKARERQLSPDSFFQLRDAVLNEAKVLRDTATESLVESAAETVRAVLGRMRATAYLVAITGPQRVGKSTLVNALLGIGISPVADYPTTAVPLLFDAGEAPRAEVAFADGRRIEEKATAEALRPFAAQQENEGNDKQVRLIRVTLPNDLLSNGVSLLDTPGLHDASEVVRDVTERALRDADAVLYVLDASLGPKFKLGRAEIEDLQALRGSKERLLVALNQADGLDAPGRDRLFEYVKSQLKKYGIWEQLPVEPMFVSAADAWAARAMGQPAPAEFATLEDEIWGHLLRNRATGMYRLVHATQQLLEAGELVSAMLSTRTRDGSEAEQIDGVRRACTDARSAIDATVRQWRQQRTSELSSFFSARRMHWLEQVQVRVGGVQRLEDLPKSDELIGLLREQMIMDGNEAFRWVKVAVGGLAADVEEKVRAALRESRGHLGIPPSLGVVVAPPQMLPPTNMALPEAQLGFFGGLLGFLVHPVVGAFTTLFGWLFGHDVAVRNRLRQARIEIPQRYNAAQRDHYPLLERQIRERVEAAASTVLMQAMAKLDTFITDATTRVERLGRPLTAQEVEALNSLSARSKEQRRRLLALQTQLAALVGVDS